jgi:Ca2+-binding EF-hand superfamily protein
LTEQYVDALFNAGDTDDDNKLSLLEFRAAVDMSRYMSGVDSDGNGFVDAVDLEDFLSQHLPEPATEAQVATVMNKSDADGDGKISFDKFRAVKDSWFTWLGLEIKPKTAKSIKTYFSPPEIQSKPTPTL